jgi:hypothetical protein
MRAIAIQRFGFFLTAVSILFVGAVIVGLV